MKIHVKICGITRAQDAAEALSLGFDTLGMITYECSPRAQSYDQCLALLAASPQATWVWVDVAPDLNRLNRFAALGYTYFQIHFNPQATSLTQIKEWSDCLGKERLWLAPRLKPGEPFNPQWFEFASSFVIDTFSPHHSGGTGLTGDWNAFRLLHERYPNDRWILAGGLCPENIQEALKRSGARWIDVNSGVESAPGLKDVQKLKMLSRALA